jgi:hypothetical protein
MRKRPSLHPAMNNVMVFAGDEVVVTVARSLGFHAMSHPAFGELPTTHAEQYVHVCRRKAGAHERG